MDRWMDGVHMHTCLCVTHPLTTFSCIIEPCLAGGYGVRVENTAQEIYQLYGERRSEEKEKQQRQLSQEMGQRKMDIYIQVVKECLGQMWEKGGKICMTEEGREVRRSVHTVLKLSTLEGNLYQICTFVAVTRQLPPVGVITSHVTLGLLFKPHMTGNLTCLSSKLFKCVGLSNWLVPGLETTPSLDCRGCPMALESAALVIFSSSSLQAYVTGTVGGKIEALLCHSRGRGLCGVLSPFPLLPLLTSPHKPNPTNSAAFTDYTLAHNV